MKNPNIQTKVVHSKSNPAWNIVGVKPLGCKYKIARVPYVPSLIVEVLEANSQEAYEHAMFISACFNEWQLVRNTIQDYSPISYPGF